jgi:tRNA-specific 2-thiouridylase
MAEIRSGAAEAPCSITLVNDNACIVGFEQPQRAITAGQAIVFYVGDQVIGGGWIERLTDPVINRGRQPGSTASAAAQAAKAQA